jgi:plastocyanin
MKHASNPKVFDRLVCYVLFALVFLLPLNAQQVSVTAQVEIAKASPHSKTRQPSSIVVWLKPADSPDTPVVREGPRPQALLAQKNKSFEPHLLVIQVGTVVDFPNHDPFFHNVFSLYDGKRFDLGLYEAGTTRHVRFDRPGVCYIFCNIHPEMSAVVVVLDTPYYGVANSAGAVSIPDVPPGRYQMHVWDERSVPGSLDKLTREVVISGDKQSLGTIRITESDMTATHKNKYGREYETPGSSPVYVQP